MCLSNFSVLMDDGARTPDTFLYEIYTLRASLRLFKLVPDQFVRRQRKVSKRKATRLFIADLK